MFNIKYTNYAHVRKYFNLQGEMMPLTKSLSQKIGDLVILD
jgi:hypothetical protein